MTNEINKPKHSTRTEIDEFTQVDAILSLAVAIDEHGERSQKRGWLILEQYDSDSGGTEKTGMVDKAKVVAVVNNPMTGVEVFLEGRENPLILPGANFSQVMEAFHDV